MPDKTSINKTVQDIVSLNERIQQEQDEQTLQVLAKNMAITAINLRTYAISLSFAEKS